MKIFLPILTFIVFVFCQEIYAQHIFRGMDMPDTVILRKDGDIFNTANFYNNKQPIAIIFFSITFKIMTAELSMMQKYYSKWKKKYGLRIVAINIDTELMPDQVARYARDVGWSYQIYLDNNLGLFYAFGAKTFAVFFNDKRRVFAYIDRLFTTPEEVQGIVCNINQPIKYLDENLNYTEKKNSLYEEHEQSNDSLQYYKRIIFYKKGNLFSEINYRTNAMDTLSDGFVSQYNESGSYISKLYYVDNKLDGECTWWYTSGFMKKEAFYTKGLLDGKCRTWYANGRAATEIEYSNGRIWNVISVFDSLGNELPRGTISNGTGVYYEYSNNGALIKETNMLNGYINGKVIEYYPSGKIKSKSNYKNGYPHGEYTEYFEDDIEKIRCSGSFSNGQVIGRLNYYSPQNGEEIITQICRCCKDKYIAGLACETCINEACWNYKIEYRPQYYIAIKLLEELQNCSVYKFH